MSSLGILREINAAARLLNPTSNQDPSHSGNGIEWGNLSYILSIGIENMNRRELRNHLEARDLSTNGTRNELITRLRDSLNDEQMRLLASSETTNESASVTQTDIEERGSVYTCGSNAHGQLGLGDVLPRRYFTVIPSLRGVGVNFIAAGVDICYAITNDHKVFVWGGRGIAQSDNTIKRDEKKIKTRKHSSTASENYWLEPRLITDLTGEEITSVCVGMSHCVALGRGGDCFLWGENDTGQLGMGDFERRPHATLNDKFPGVVQIHCGANHSAALYRDGQVYTWGHSSNGRLGIGVVERPGVLDSEKFYWPIPQNIKSLEPIRQISCGADHTLAFGASGVWAWGSGAGGKLGLGDTKDRLEPNLIPELRGKFILQVIASTWHSLALIAYPPMTTGGWIHTWGSGYHGQLAQGSKQVILSPEVVEYFVTYHLLIKYISTGSHHSAALTIDGELYTWGSNVNGCLGRRISETDVLYTPIPGYVSGFGAIVGKIGRGIPRHVTCGKEFTVVCTHPYTGPDLFVATKLMEETKIREQEMQLAKRAEQQYREENVTNS